MDTGRMFTENWPYKVAAIVLSVLLWLSVSAGVDRAEQSVPTRLEVALRDTTWSLREVRPPDVMTTFGGTRGDVFATMFEQPTIRKFVDEVTDPVMQLQLSVNEVLYDPSLGVEPTSVDPVTVTIFLEERKGKMVPVVGRTDATPSAGSIIVEMDVEPDSVYLSGPTSFVDAMNEVPTEILVAGEVSQSVTRQLAIALPPDLTGLEVRPVNVLGSVEVDSMRTRRFQRVVQADGPFADGLTFDPPTITVSVSGASSTVDALQASDLQVLVTPTARVTGPTSLQVQVRLPADATATTSHTPDRVQVTPATPSSN